MCAMMPMFRYRSSGVSRAIVSGVSIHEKNGATEPDESGGIAPRASPASRRMGALPEHPTRCRQRAGGGERGSSHYPICFRRKDGMTERRKVVVRSQSETNRVV